MTVVYIFLPCVAIKLRRLKVKVKDNTKIAPEIAKRYWLSIYAISWVQRDEKYMIGRIPCSTWPFWQIKYSKGQDLESVKIPGNLSYRTIPERWIKFNCNAQNSQKHFYNWSLWLHIITIRITSLFIMIYGLISDECTAFTPLHRAINPSWPTRSSSKLTRSGD